MKLLEIDWFRNARTTTCANDALVIRNHRVGGHSDDRDISQIRMLPDPGSQCQTILAAKSHIEQNGAREMSV